MVRFKGLICGRTIHLLPILRNGIVLLLNLLFELFSLIMTKSRFFEALIDVSELVWLDSGLRSPILVKAVFELIAQVEVIPHLID